MERRAGKINIRFQFQKKNICHGTMSLIHAQIIRVISSPSNSTTGLATLIRFCGGADEPKIAQKNKCIHLHTPF